MTTFTEVFQEIRVDKQEPCPECHGVGWLEGVTCYVDKARNTAFICPTCLGTGSACTTHKPDPKVIKDQMFLAGYFHKIDPTQMSV